MDREKVIRILLFYKNIDKEVSYNQSIIKELENDYYSMNGGGGLDGQPRGKNHISSPTERTALAVPETVSDSIRFWRGEIERLRGLKQAVAAELSKLPFEHRRIIYDFYVQGRKWVQISEQVHYSGTQCKKIRNRGLVKLAEYFSLNNTIAGFDFS